jgi:hypothetical protein
MSKPRHVHFDPSLSDDDDDTHEPRFTLHWFEYNILKKEAECIQALSHRDLLRFQDALKEEHRQRLVYPPKLLIPYYASLSLIRCELERRQEPSSSTSPPTHTQ